MKSTQHLRMLMPECQAILKAKQKKEVNELIKEKILLEKPTFYGIQVSLNSEKIKEIMQYLEN
jgi:hypothetical protein